MKSKLFACFLICCLLDALMSIASSADVTVTVYSTEDAYIKMISPDQNYGSSSQLKVMNRHGHPSNPDYFEYDALIRFDLSSIPLGASIVSARLNLYYASYGCTDPGGRDLTLYRITSHWDEGTVTWNARPSHDPGATAATIVPSTQGHWMEWDVTDDVQAFVNEQEINYGWQLMDTTRWGNVNIPMMRFRSREHGESIPYLVVEIDGEYHPPTAFIDDISPNPADEGEEVIFSGHGEDADGSVVAYNWNSTVDGFLSDQASFSASDLSDGTHTILFKVQDDDSLWSEEVSATLEIIGSPNVDSGLVAYWSFDDGTATDETGNGHHGVIHGDPQFVDGISGGAFDFDGHDDYIQIAYDQDLAPESYTVIVWYKAEEDQMGEMIAKGISKLFYQIQFRSSLGDGDVIEFWYEDQYDHDYHILSEYGYELNQFFMATMAFTNGRLTAYVNDVNVGDEYFGISPYDNGIGVYIGRGDSGFFNGLLDEVRIYNRKLSQAEIEYLYRNPGGEKRPITLKIGKVDNVLAGQRHVCVPVCLSLQDHEVEIGGWEILMWYDPTAGSVVGVDQYACGFDSVWAHDPEFPDPDGWEWIEPLFAEDGYEPEYFNYVLGADGHANWVRIVGLMNMDWPQEVTPAIQEADDDILFSLIVDVAPNVEGHEMFFGWEVTNCTDNTFGNFLGSVLYGPRKDSRPTWLACSYHGSTDVVELYNYPAGSPGFSIGQVERGDINCNGVAYSVADALMFISYLVSGDDALRDDDGPYHCGSFDVHCQASDIDRNGLCFTVGDLVQLIRIINGHDEPPPARQVPADLVVSLSDGEVSVDQKIGGARFSFAGEGEVNGEDLSVTHRDGKTIVLVYTLDDRTLSGTLFTIVGDVKLENVEAADFFGNPLLATVFEKPARFALAQNHPNPFNPETEIAFDLAKDSWVKLSVYNVAGQKIDTLVDGELPAGNHKVSWNARSVSTGIYFYRLEAGDIVATRKMVVLK